VPEAYKYVYNNPGVNWESSVPKLTTPDSGPNDYNRVHFLVNGPSVLPVVMFDDKQLNDYLPVDTTVTFKVNMNGAIGTDGHVFDSSVDTLWLNGEFIPWYAWWGGVNPAPAPAQYQMTENPVGSGVFSNSVVLPRGTRVSFAYKFGIGHDGAQGPFDDEAPVGSDHLRVIRTTATGVYVLPQDKFGVQYHEPFFNASARADGQLAVGPRSGNTVPVSWLGRPGAHLQSSVSVNGPWTDHTITDGATWSSGIASTNGLISITNWPATGSTFFRLVK
jgi:hypothetical protein